MTSAFVLASSASVAAATLSIGPAGSGAEFSEIQAAIDAATNGDELLVAPGEYRITESLTFRGKSVRLRSEAGPEGTTVRMLPGLNGSPSVFLFIDEERRSAELEGFTLTGGGDRDRYGAGVYCYRSSPTLRSCVITRNLNAVGRGGSGVSCRDASPVLIECTITYNAGSNGGGLFCWGTSFPTLEDCTIASNIGGGVFCGNGARPELFNCTVVANLAADLGSVSVTVRDCDVIADVSNRDNGVGLRCVESFPTLVECIVWANQDGSILSDALSDVTVNFSCVEGSDVWPGIGNIIRDPLLCGWDSGGVFVHDQADLESALDYRVALSVDSPCLGAGEGGRNMGATTELCETVGSTSRTLRLSPGRYRMPVFNLHENVSVEGAGEDQTILEGTVWAPRTGAFLSGVTVTGGRAGGIRVVARAAPEIRDCTITRNTTPTDAGPDDPGDQGISSGHNGGGVFCGPGTSPTLIGCTITNNFSLWEGGGFFCTDATPSLLDCTIEGNLSGRSGGGGMAVIGRDSRTTITDCRIIGNSADGRGGGVRVRSGQATLVNCVIAGNRSLGRGGGVSIATGSECGLWNQLINCTVAGNSAEWEGGGVHCGDEPTDRLNTSLLLTNSIIWDNRADQWPDRGNDLCGEVDRSLSDVDPLFARTGTLDLGRRIPVSFGYGWLPNYVVEAPDFRLRPGSPAIDAGRDDIAPATDIENRVRPCGGRVDLGPYELCDQAVETTPFRRGDTNADGALNLTDGLFVLNFLFGQGAPPPCRDAADSNDGGSIDLSDAVVVFNFLFTGEAPPPPPGPAVCGVDATPDELSCDAFEACE